MKWRRRHIDKALRKNLDLFLLCSFQKQSNRWFFSIEIVEDICSAYGNKCRRKEGHCEVGYLLYSYICGPINKERIITGNVTRLRCLWQMPLLTPALVCYLRWSQCWSSTSQGSARQAGLRDHTTHQSHDVLHPHILHFYALLQSVDLGQDLFTFPFHHNGAPLPRCPFFVVELRILRWLWGRVWSVQNKLDRFPEILQERLVMENMSADDMKFLCKLNVIGDQDFRFLWSRLWSASPRKISRNSHQETDMVIQIFQHLIPRVQGIPQVAQEYKRRIRAVFEDAAPIHRLSSCSNSGV